MNLRLVISAVILLCLNSTKTYSEPPRGRRGGKPARVYFLFELSENTFIVPKTGVMTVNFPYTITTKTATSSNSFKGSYSNFFSSPLVSYGLAAQFPSKKRHFYDLSFGLGGAHRGENSPYSIIGYGQKVFSKNNWAIKAAIDVGYYEFGNSLGSINDQGKIITLLGTRVDSMFTVKGKNTTSTYQSKEIDLRYIQKDLVMIPKIAFEYKPSEARRFYAGLTFSYIVPLYEEGAIRWEQNNNNGNISGSGDHSLTSGGLALTYNNQPTTTTPYHFQGLQMSVKVGWVVGRRADGK
ncbi:MAG: hypothetical protein QM734_14550 [Cyclobacteriaceae bacterium]